MLCKDNILVEDECLLRHRQELSFENKIQIVLMDRRCVSAPLWTGPERLNVYVETHHTTTEKKATGRRQSNTTKGAIKYRNNSR